MKILHTNFHRGWGGQSNRILIVCRGLAAKGHRVTLAAPGGSELARRAADAGLRVFDDVCFARGMRLGPLGRDIRALRELIRRESFDIVHTHGSQDSWAVGFALRGFPHRPIVLRTKHNMFPIRDHFFNRLLYGRWTDGIVCISHAILEYCAAKPYLKRENLSLAHSAVDFDQYSSAAGDRSLRAEFGVEDRYVIGIVGRLREEKGHRHLLEAMPRILTDAPEAVLLVVGAGSLGDDLQRRARELGIGDRVIFTGFRADIPRALAALDVFALPSLSEGLGTAILEAAAAGLPIVASRVGGVPDIIEDGVGGLLTPPGDPAALASAILRFWSDRNFALRCAEAARSRVRSQFSEQALVDKKEEIYVDWLRRSGRFH